LDPKVVHVGFWRAMLWVSLPVLWRALTVMILPVLWFSLSLPVGGKSGSAKVACSLCAFMVNFTTFTIGCIILSVHKVRIYYVEMTD